MSILTTTGYSMHHVPCTDIGGFDALAELALILDWSWNHGTDGVLRKLDPIWWAIISPSIMLQTAPGNQIKQLFSDPEDRKETYFRWQR